MKKLQKYLFFLILIVFPFGQLFRLNLSYYLPGLRIHLIDFVIFIFVVSWFLGKLFKKENLILPFFSKELLIFCLIAFICLFLQAGKLKLLEFLGASFYLFRFINFVTFFFALADFFKTEKLDIYSCLIGEGVVIAFFSLLQYEFIPDTRFLFNFGWDEHYYRAIGSFLDPSFTGLFLVLSFITLMINFVDRAVKKNLLSLLAGFLLLLAIGLTFSRIAIFSLIVGLGTIFSIKRNAFFCLSVCLVLLGIIVFLPKPGGEGENLLRVSSFVARISNYKQTLAIVKDHFLFGVGFNAYRYTQKEYGFLSSSDWRESNAGAGSDNSFLFVFATTGIFGLSAFLYFWLRLIYFSFVFSQRTKSSLLLFTSTVSLTMSSFVVNSLFYAWVMVWVMILLANFTVDNKLSTRILFCSGQGQD